MNITIITILLPYPLTSGGAQAQYNMIDVLRKHHHITIIFPLGGQNHKWALKQLRIIWPEVTFCPYSYFRQILYFPFFINKVTRFFKLVFKSNSESFQKERILKPYGYVINNDFIQFMNNIIHHEHTDIVQIEFYPFLKLASYLPKSVKKVFVHHEIRFIRNERNLKRFTLNNYDIKYMQHLKLEEIADLNKFDKIATLTTIDKDILVTNGVYVPIVISPAAIEAKVLPYKGWNNSLVFLGGIGHAPNIEGMNWLCNEVLPLIDWGGKFHNVYLNVIGKGWHKKNIVGIPQRNICIKGFVPKLENIAYGGIMIVPILSGSGMRMKILEGAALGMPIITTTVGIEGINLRHGESCIIADKPSEFAEGIIKLMTNGRLRERLSVSAQSIYLKYYSKEALVSQREDLYKI